MRAKEDLKRDPRVTDVTVNKRRDGSAEVAELVQVGGSFVLRRAATGRYELTDDPARVAALRGRCKVRELGRRLARRQAARESGGGHQGPAGPGGRTGRCAGACEGDGDL